MAAERKRYRHVEDGEGVDTEVIVCKPEEWPKLPEASNPSWLAATFDRDLCVAVRRPVVAFGGIGHIDD